MKVTYKKGVVVDGTDYGSDQSFETEDHSGFDKALAAAKTGQLTTRTSGTAGTITGQAAHGVLTGDKLHIYWTAAAHQLAGGVGTETAGRCAVVVGTVAGNSIPFTTGVGDALPANLTQITMQVPLIENVAATGANVTVIAAKNLGNKQPAMVRYTQANGTLIATVNLGYGPTGAYTWVLPDGSANPVAAADIAKVELSHGDATQGVTLRGKLGWN